MGSQAILRNERIEELRNKADALFMRYACELDSLEQLVLRAAEANPGLRCAAPFTECLDETFPAPQIEEVYTLLAADGSQINPDRHAQVEFGAINVGAIRMRPGSGQPPQEMVRSKLM